MSAVATGRGAHLLLDDGSTLDLAVERWLASPAPEEAAVLERARPAVLDVGCGPGRHVLALAERGVTALGVEIAPHAVRIASERGAPVLERSIFERLPGAGRWSSALLLDGNIGIGGDPAALLARLAELLHDKGQVLVEVEGPLVESRTLRARVVAHGQRSDWFAWGIVSVTDVGDFATRAGFALRDCWTDAGRYFSCLEVA